MPDPSDIQAISLPLPKTVAAIGTTAFGETLQRELAAQADRLLPILQEALCHSDRALTEGLRVVPLHVERREGGAFIRAGIFYQGITAGSCCADDPTPVEPVTEYCELGLTACSCPGGRPGEKQ